MDRISYLCEHDNCKCCAEKAFNEISKDCPIYAYDVRDRLCSEIDTPEDLSVVSSRLWEIENRTVYMCFGTDIIHSGHIAIIHEAAKLGRLIAGVLSDEAIMEYRRKPLFSLEDRLNLLRNIKRISEVTVQNKLSYVDILRKLKPTYVVHGDDWREGVQKDIREEVVEILAEYGGRLVEFPYCMDDKYKELEQRLALIK